MTKTKPAKRPPVHGYRYPIFCGLVVGGLLGGITQSLSLALLFGGVAWAYFFFDFFHRLPAGAKPCMTECEDVYQPGYYSNWVEAANHGCMGGGDGTGGPGFYH